MSQRKFLYNKKGRTVNAGGEVAARSQENWVGVQAPLPTRFTSLGVFADLSGSELSGLEHQGLGHRGVICSFLAA